MSNNCPTTPYEEKESILTKKQNPYTSIISPYINNLSFCGIILQENKYPILLENGLQIRYE